MRKLHKAKQGALLPYYWRDGKLLDHRKNGVSTVPTWSQAMDYSLVIIEGLRVNRAADYHYFGFRFKDHMARMVKGWESLELRCPFSVPQLVQGLQACAQANIEYLKSQGRPEDLYLRPKLFVTDPVIKPFAGATTGVAIECIPLGDYLAPGGIAVTLADFVRTFRYSHYATKGAGKYPEYGMMRDSVSEHYDDILQLGLGTGGKLIFTEGTSSNVFMVKGGVLFTPGKDDFTLHGMTRDTVIHLARHASIKVKEGQVPLSLILEADELFVTGTASLVTPVTQLGRFAIGTGPVTKKIMALFQAARLGKIVKFKSWLTPLNA